MQEPEKEQKIIPMTVDNYGDRGITFQMNALDVVQMFITEKGKKDRSSIAYLKQIIKDQRKELNVLLVREEEIVHNLDKNRKLSRFQKETAAMILIGVYVTQDRERLEEHLERNKRIIRMVENYGSDTPSSELSIEKARLVPITDFLQPNRANFVECPWHSERTRSCKYYPKDNKIHCFGCNKGGDVIDVVQQTMNKTFKEAVGFLTK